MIDKSRNSKLKHYLYAVAVVVVCTLVASLLFPYFSAENLSMVYLTGIVVTALYYGRGPSILATVLSVVAFDFFLIVPYHTFAITDVQYVFTLLVMLLVAVTVSTLAARSGEQTAIAQEREHRAASLYALNRKFTNAPGLQALFNLAVQHIGEEFRCTVWIFAPEQTEPLCVAAVHEIQKVPEPDLGTAQQVYSHQVASFGSENPARHGYLYTPLRASGKAVGVLVLYRTPLQRGLLPAERQFLDALADQTALALYEPCSRRKHSRLGCKSKPSGCETTS